MFFPLHQFPAKKEGKNVLLLVGTPFEERKNTICTSVLILFLFCIRNILNIFVVFPRCQTVQKKNYSNYLGIEESKYLPIYVVIVVYCLFSRITYISIEILR